MSKWEGEIASREICQRAGVSWTAIRPTLIYGPGSRYGLAPFIAALDTSARANRRLLLPNGGPLCHAVHVDDVARAVWHAVQQQLEGPYISRPNPNALCRIESPRHPASIKASVFTDSMVSCETGINPAELNKTSITMEFKNHGEGPITDSIS